MNYELEKELYSNGYPEKFSEVEGEVSSPTLSELISKCEDNRFNLGKLSTGYWVARHADTPYVSEGSTPEEAVAKLWLALNKNI